MHDKRHTSSRDRCKIHTLKLCFGRNKEKKTIERECIAMKYRGSLLQKVNKICILSVLITDLWLLLKEKVAAASLHVWLSNSDDTAVKCCAPHSVQWETERAACVCHLQRAVQRESRRDLLCVDESARKTPHLEYKERSPLMHSSSREKFSWFSHLSMCD